MDHVSIGGEGSPALPSSSERSEVAALAARIAALPHDATALHPSVPGQQTRVREVRDLRNWFWRICYFTVWGIAIVLAAVAALRVFYHDGNYILTWLNAFTRYVYLPAYACLLWAAWQRRWLLTLLCLAIVGCHIAWMTPNFIRDRRFDVLPAIDGPPAASSPTVRILFANVRTRNHEFGDVLNLIEIENPDIVVVAEFTFYWLRAFRESPVMAPYVYGSDLRGRFESMVNIFSRIPLKAEHRLWLAGRSLETVDVQLGSDTLRIIGLHAPRPIYTPDVDYFEFWNQVVPVLTTEQGPLVIVGDFNATEHSLVYKQLRAAGLRSAHDDRGRGYASTWPNGYYLLPPIRIDQAFLSADVECERITEGQSVGSDHKPIILDIRLRRPIDRNPVTPSD